MNVAQTLYLCSVRDCLQDGAQKEKDDTYWREVNILAKNAVPLSKVLRDGSKEFQEDCAVAK